MPSLALLPFLISGPDLEVWLDCWVSVEFLHAPILQKGSGNTTGRGRVAPRPDVSIDAYFSGDVTCSFRLHDIKLFFLENDFFLTLSCNPLFDCQTIRSLNVCRLESA